MSMGKYQVHDETSQVSFYITLLLVEMDLLIGRQIQMMDRKKNKAISRFILTSFS